MITTPLPDRPLEVVIVAEVASSLKDSFARDPRFALRERLSPDPAGIVAAAAGATILVTRHHNRITSEALDQLPALRVIGQATSGIDNIDPSAADRGIRIVSTPGANANAVAEYVLGQILTITRDLTSYHGMVSAGEWDRGDCATRHELRHYRLGLVGIGNVGSRVAAVGGVFGMEVFAYDPYVSPEETARRGASSCATLEELLDRTDILSLHAPFTEETAGMISDREIRRLRAGAVVINAARGELIDLAALVGALNDGHLAGAACDVFDPEPAQLPNPLPATLRLTPHIAGCTSEAKEDAGIRLYRAICDALDLEPLESR